MHGALKKKKKRWFDIHVLRFAALVLKALTILKFPKMKTCATFFLLHYIYILFCQIEEDDNYARKKKKKEMNIIELK